MTPIALDGPAVEPVSVAEMRDFLRLDDGAQDDLVAALIAAARVTLEAATRRAFLAQAWRVRLPCWPPDRVVALPLAPVMAVDAVRIGAATLDPGLYRLDAAGDPARLLLDPTIAPPSRGQAVEVDLTLGYGDVPQAVPAPLRLALQRLVARWFENRGDAVAAGLADLKGDIAALIAPYLRPRVA